MNSLPLVSVVITAYNSEEYIEKCVFSVVEQTYKNLEILIIDDCSTDNTYEKLKNIEKLEKRIKLYKNENNKGYLKTFNKSLKLTRGDFVTFVDSDDFIDTKKIELQVEFFLQNPGAGFVGTSFKRINDQDKVVFTEILPIERNEIKNALKDQKKMPICGSSIMLKKEVIDEFGGYNDYFDGCSGEDLDWISRIIERYDGNNLKDPLYYYRFKKNSLTRKIFTTVKEREIRKIITFLINQREKNSGKDSLNYKIEGLDEFIKTLEANYSNDKGLMNRKISFDYAVNGEFGKSLKYFFKSTKYKFSLKEIKLVICIAILFVFPKTILLKTMPVFGVKNISNRI